MNTDEIMALADRVAAVNYSCAIAAHTVGGDLVLYASHLEELNKVRYGLRTAIEALVADAERYRWLCSHMIFPSPSLWDNGVAFGTPRLSEQRKQMTMVELNAAIDAARSGT